MYVYVYKKYNGFINALLTHRHGKHGKYEKQQAIIYIAA